MALRTLWDSPVLVPLARAAKRTGVEVELFGSVATRALLFDAAGVRVRDLFELVEHASDINLAHDGPPIATRMLERAIAEEVPMASWFRWSVLDRSEARWRRQLDRRGIALPLRQLRLGTRPLSSDENVDRVLDRALEGLVEISLDDRALPERPPLPLSEEYEASAGLLFIDATVDALEAQLRSNKSYAFSVDDRAGALIAEGLDQLENLTSSNRHSRLQQLWRRLAGTAMRIPPDLFEFMTSRYDLARLFALLEDDGFPANSLGISGTQPFLVSAHAGDGYSRVAHLSDRNGGFGDWRGLFDEMLARVGTEPTMIDAPLEPIKLAPQHEVIAAVRDIVFKETDRSWRSYDDYIAKDFLHIGLRIPKDAGTLDAERLTAIVFRHNRSETALLPAPVVVSTALPMPFPSEDGVPWPAERCTIRLNLADALRSDEEMTVFLVKGSGA